MLLSRMETLQMHSRRGFEVSPPSVYGRFLRWSYLNLSSEKSLHTVQSSKTIKTNQTTFATVFISNLWEIMLGVLISSCRMLSKTCVWTCGSVRFGVHQIHRLVSLLSLPFVTKKVANKFHHKQRTPNEEIEDTFFFVGGRNHKNFTLKELDLWRFWRCHRPRLLRNIFALIDAPIVANEVLVWTQRIHRKCMVKACGTGLKCVKHVTFDLPNIFLN